MRRPTWLPMIALLAAACAGSPPASRGPQPRWSESPSAVADFAAEGRAAAARLQTELQKALAGAIGEGGPAHALGVCSAEAPRLAASIAAETGLIVRRVAARTRNPANAPTDAQRNVLRAFQARPASEDTVIFEGGTPSYMRAIRIGVDLCLRCHGDPSRLDEEVRAGLAELYPQDSATGFAMGDLRGAFVVRPAGDRPSREGDE